MKWKLYYSDGSTFSSEEGSWDDAPYRGALILASQDPDVGREIDQGERGEFFAWWDDAEKPWGFDKVGILDYLVECRGYEEGVYLSDLSLEDWKEAGVKLGRSVENRNFRKIMREAVEDDFLPPKSAKTQREV